MSHCQISNRVQVRRLALGWSQVELAQRAGISRAAVSAIEITRLTPSVTAALGLARALGCSVEDLFGVGSATSEPEWAWPAPHEPAPCWRAVVQNRTLLYPVEHTLTGTVAHDGVVQGKTVSTRPAVAPENTLVVATCDPAAGLLARAYQHASGLRMIVLPRSSRQALELVAQGLVHVAGVHLAATGDRLGNAQAVRACVGPGFCVVRVASWQEGLALAPGLGVKTVGGALRSRLTWVGRETGSGARQCLDELRGGRRPPRMIARDHRGVAEAVRSGWADVGVCLQLACAEAGLRFLSIREEAYDLCFAAATEADPRIQALLGALRSPQYREQLAALPGYSAANIGDVTRVN